MATFTIAYAPKGDGEGNISKHILVGKLGGAGKGTKVYPNSPKEFT